MVRAPKHIVDKILESKGVSKRSRLKYKPIEQTESDPLTKYKYRNGELVGYTVHPGLYKARKSKKIISELPTKSKSRKRVVSQRARRSMKYERNESFDMSVFDEFIKNRRLPVKDDTEEIPREPPYTKGDHSASSVAFLDALDKALRVNNKLPFQFKAGIGSLIGWSRFLVSPPFVLDEPWQFATGYLHWLRQAPTIVALSDSEDFPYMEASRRFPNFRLFPRKREEPKEVFALTLPLDIQGLPIITFIDTPHIKEQLSVIKPDSRRDFLARYIRNYISDFMDSRPEIPFNITDQTAWDTRFSSEWMEDV